MSIKAHQMMAWLSPAFPTGGFAYSHGLEAAIAHGLVHDAASLTDWLSVVLTKGAAWNDAILLVEAFKGNDVTELGQALAGSKERLQETLDQGRNFARTASRLLNSTLSPAPLPIVLGQAAAIAGLDLEELVGLYLHNFSANLISAAIRLVPLGQTDGQIVLQSLFELMDQQAHSAIQAGLDDLANASVVADIMAMQHEDMTTRIFRT